MAKASEVYVKISAKDGTAQGIGSAERRLNSFGSSAAKIGGLIAGAFAISRIISFGKEAANLYNVQAQAEQQLLVALKGRSDIQQDLIKQAKELQTTTLFGDEETIRAQALIAAFVKEGDAIKKVMPLVQDFAAAKGMDLAGAADLVSKTLGSSTNALSRYGLEVKGQVGSVERLTSLVNGLNDAFGGQAAAAAKVGTGQVTQMSNEWGDLKEKIGKAIVESDSFRDSISKTSQLMFVLGSDSATTLEKWAMALELSDKRAERIYNQVKKRQEEFIKQQEGASAAVASFEKSISEPPPPIDTEPIVNVAKRIAELNSQVAELQQTFRNPNIEFAAAQKAFAEAEKLKKEIEGLNKILSFGKRDAIVPALMETKKETPQIGGEGMTQNLGVLPLETDKLEAFGAGYLEKYSAMMQELQDETDALNDAFNFALVDGLVGGIEAAIGGASFGGVMKALLTPIASVLEEEGKILIIAGLGIEAFKKALSTLNGVAAIAIGGLLIGAAQGIKALGSTGSGGGGGGGFSGATAGGGSAGNYTNNAPSKIAIDINGELVARGDALVYSFEQASYNASRTRS